jgi:uncharacterized membrane protein YdjX (TVP38/TMEM64 family)|tara:strand:+ start:614 stop:1288 length:675 start_codon:yes stop_codon:yes gene_type:complete
MTERLNYMKSKKYLYLVALLALVIYFYNNNSLFEKIILDNIVNLENYYIQNPIFFMFSYFIIYVVLTTLSLPVALVLGLLSGFIFDLYSAIILISFASSFGATAAMLISRYLISDYINRKFLNEISLIDNEVNKHGAYYLFALRMSPIFPFFVINAAFGITKIKTLTFYLISQLGMLPGTIIIILIGSELNDFLIKGSPFSIDLVLYLTLLGLIPLLFKKYIRF